MYKRQVYFVGAGGIGMSALVRYFLFKGKVVAGYDRTPTPLTETLIAEEMCIRDRAYVSSHIEFASYLNIMYIPGSEELVIYICAFIGALILSLIHI